MVRKQLLYDSGLAFQPDTYCEDVGWCGELMAATQSTAFFDAVFYAYRVRKGSSSQSISQKHIEDLYGIIQSLTHLPLGAHTDPFKAAFNAYVAYQYCTLLINIRFAPKENLAANLRRCRDYRFLLKHDIHFPVRLARMVSAVAGIRCCSFLLYWYYRLRKK